MVSWLANPELADNNREGHIEEEFSCVRFDEFGHLRNFSVKVGERSCIDVICNVVIFFLFLKGLSNLLEHELIGNELIIDP